MPDEICSPCRPMLGVPTIIAVLVHRAGQAAQLTVLRARRWQYDGGTPSFLVKLMSSRSIAFEICSLRVFRLIVSGCNTRSFAEADRCWLHCFC